MTCAELIEQAEALALGALEPEEQRACEEHLAQAIAHEGCREAVERARETVGAMSAMLDPVSAPPALWRRIEQQLRPGSRTRALREWTAWGLAAAALLALVVLGGRVASQRARATELLRREQSAATDFRACRDKMTALERSGALVQEAVALLESPGARVVAMVPQKGEPFRAAALVDPSRHKVMLVSRSLIAPPGRVFQLWVIRGKAPPVPAGRVERAVDGAVVATFEPTVLANGAPDAVAVSVEPESGSLTPTRIVLMGSLAG